MCENGARFSAVANYLLATAWPLLMACVGILKCAAKVVHIVQKMFGEMVVGAVGFCSFILQPKKKRERGREKKPRLLCNNETSATLLGVFW